MAVTLTIPDGAFQLSGNPIYIDVATTTTGKTLHKLCLTITCTNGVVSGGPWSDFIAVDDDGGARFDIQALMNIDANYDFSTEQETPTDIIEHAQIAANFTVACSEKYVENGSIVENAGNSNTLVVLKGGISSIDQALPYRSLNDYVSDDRFLTKMPETTIIPFDCWPLLWVAAAADANVEIRFRAEYADGYSTSLLTGANYLNGKMYEIATNPLAYGLSKYHEGAQITEVAIINNIDSQSQDNQIILKISENYFETLTEFYFVNQLGGVDLVVCFGLFQELTETEGDFSVKTLAKDPVLKDPTKISHRKTIGTKFKVETGFIPLEQRRWLIDLFASEQVWWKTDRFGVPTGEDFGLIPVRILPGTFNLNDTTEDLMSVQFEFELAHIDKYI